MSRRVLVVIGAAAVFLAAPLVSAIPQQEAETRIIAVTTFKVPFTDFGEFNSMVDKYVIPSVKANPHILSYRMAGHYWGSTRHTVWIIAEYENLAGIEEADSWGDKYYDDNYPEGSAKRDSADKAFQEKFLPYFQDHTDNILSFNVNRSK